VAIQGGAINITFGKQANRAILGKVLSLARPSWRMAPIVPVTWVCGYAIAPEKMTVKGENKTNIHRATCRSVAGRSAAIARMQGEEK